MNKVLNNKTSGCIPGWAELKTPGALGIEPSCSGKYCITIPPDAEASAEHSIAIPLEDMIIPPGFALGKDDVCNNNET